MLTDPACKTAKPKAKPYKLHDSAGLFLLVAKSGSRLWRFKYRVGKREKLLALGTYPLVSLKRAREKRDEARRLLLEGTDPAAQRAQLRATEAATFAVVHQQWLTKQTFAAATLGRAQWLFESWLKPAIGERPIGSIEPCELLTLLQKAEAAGKRETAHRLRARVSQVFRFAIATGLATRDPAADLRGALASVVVENHAAVTEPKKVGALLRAIDGYDGQPHVAIALRLAPHLFVRPGELRAAEWSEFDTDAKEWRIPAVKTKLRTLHIVPLSRQALALLEQLRALTGRGRFLFPAVGNSERCMSENTLNAALRRLGYTGSEMTSHGFRAMASTLLNERGVSPDLIELQLAHKERNKVRAAYNRAERLAERHKLMQDWSDYLDQLRLTKE